MKLQRLLVVPLVVLFAQTAFGQTPSQSASRSSAQTAQSLAQQQKDDTAQKKDDAEDQLNNAFTAWATVLNPLPSLFDYGEDCIDYGAEEYGDDQFNPQPYGGLKDEADGDSHWSNAEALMMIANYKWQDALDPLAPNPFNPYTAAQRAVLFSEAADLYDQAKEQYDDAYMKYLFAYVHFESAFNWWLEAENAFWESDGGEEEEEAEE